MPGARFTSPIAKPIASIGRLPNGTAAGGHGAAVSESGDVYLAQLSGKVQKFVKQ